MSCSRSGFGSHAAYAAAARLRVREPLAFYIWPTTRRGIAMSRTEEFELIIVGGGPAGSAPPCTPAAACSRPCCSSVACPAVSCSTPSGSTTIPGFEHVLGPRAGAARWRRTRQSSAPTSARRTWSRSPGATTASSRSPPRRHDLRGAGGHPHRGRHPHQAGRARRARVRGPRRLLLRGVRRRVLQGRDDRGGGRRRRRGGRGRLPHALRGEGVRDPPPRRVPRVEDPAGAAVREPQDRGHLEQAGARAQGRPGRPAVDRARGHA